MNATELKRVVVTGLGVVSCLGNNLTEVTSSLLAGKSGISYNASYEEIGMRSHVSGTVKGLDFKEHIDRKQLRFMGDAAAYGHIAMSEAIAHAGLEPSDVVNPRSGLVVGTGGASAFNLSQSADVAREKGVKRMGPYRVPKTMSSTASACLANAFQIKGINYSITSACATSVHCIGAAAEQIQWGKQDIVFAGGCEEEHWTQSSMFDAMGALSSSYNDTPETASRPYDATRDGFVIAGGGGILVLEELEHAKARGAKIYGELVGYAANSDGYDMVAPSGEGAVRCMNIAKATVDTPIDYINTHGTSTPVGDVKELGAVKEVFGDKIPPISSTKSLSGHSLGATGAHEAIYCLIMMENDFIAASANINELDPMAEGIDIVTERRDNAGLTTVMTNSFGFGGTNGCIVMRKLG